MFTLAHSITLSMAVLGLVNAPAAVAEPLIALSIVWVAVENMLGEGRVWHRFAVAFVFGLVHGLGFADALMPLARKRSVKSASRWVVGSKTGTMVPHKPENPENVGQMSDKY
jgi:hypothetical protein